MKYFMRFFVYIKKLGLHNGIVISVACVVVISQLCINFSVLSNYVSGENDSVPVSSDYANHYGKITLNLTSGEPGEDIKILVNGDEYSDFTNKQVEIEIKTQTVIEILNNTSESVAVDVGELSNNVQLSLNNSGAYIDKIGVIARVVFKN